MSSTNKTTNYDLSQFTSTDKPAWLSDYNTDMSKIDGQMKLNADTATAASGAASAATTAVGTLANLATDDKTSAVAAINEVDLHADTAQNTANTASANATTALNTAQTALANTALLNLTNITRVSASSFTNVTNFTNMSGSLTIAANSDGSVFKLYGSISFNKQFGVASFKFTSNIRPAAEITISPIGFYCEDSGYMRVFNATIATTGEVSMTVYGGTQNDHDAIFPPCIYFAKDFNDSPITQ